MLEEGVRIYGTPGVPNNFPYAKGLPLALKIIGADLYGQTNDEWKRALEKYKRFPNGDIQEILKISL